MMNLITVPKYVIYIGKILILCSACFLYSQALADINIHDNNTLFGDNQSSSDNVFIGTETTGSSLTSGRDNIAIGNRAFEEGNPNSRVW